MRSHNDFRRYPLLIVVGYLLTTIVHLFRRCVFNQNQLQVSRD